MVNIEPLSYCKLKKMKPTTVKGRGEQNTREPADPRGFGPVRIASSVGYRLVCVKKSGIGSVYGLAISESTRRSDPTLYSYFLLVLVRCCIPHGIYLVAHEVTKDKIFQ